MPRRCSRGTEPMSLSIFSRIPLGSLERLDWFSNLIFIIWSSMIAFGAGNHLSDIFMEDNLILQISKGQRAEIRQEGLSPIINIMSHTHSYLIPHPIRSRIKSLTQF